MKKQPFVSVSLSGVSLTEFGLEVPSPFCSLELTNSEIASYTSWVLTIVVGGDANRKMNIAAFEALIYSAAQTEGYANASGVPVAFIFGWLDEHGSVAESVSYQGYTLNYSATTSGMFMNYTLKGYASQAVVASMPVFNIPALSGYVQPSAVLEGLVKGVGADAYYQLDLDRTDSPTLITHNAMTTSFMSYVRGDRTAEDDYDTFPGLLSLAKSYNSTRDAAGVRKGKLSTILNNATVTPVKSFLKKSLTDDTAQSTSFAFWIDEPTMTHPGIIHFKDRGTMIATSSLSSLRYGTKDSNILTLSGTYDGIAYNISSMNFGTVGFTLDESGTMILNDASVVNSWASSLHDVYQTANIINDVNALSTQFSGSFAITIPGNTSQFSLCQPVSLIVMSRNTLSPVSGIYNISSVTHSISTTFVTGLKLVRLAVSSANATALGGTISMQSRSSGVTTTPNIKSTNKVDFGKMYPRWEDVI